MPEPLTPYYVTFGFVTLSLYCTTSRICARRFLHFLVLRLWPGELTRVRFVAAITRSIKIQADNGTAGYLNLTATRAGCSFRRLIETFLPARF